MYYIIFKCIILWDITKQNYCIVIIGVQKPQTVLTEHYLSLLQALD